MLVDLRCSADLVDAIFGQDEKLIVHELCANSVTPIS